MNISKVSRKARLLSSVVLCSLVMLLATIDVNSAKTSRYFDGSISAKSAVLIDADSRKVLFRKNPDIPLGEASTTKIMTALVVSEHIDMDKKVSVHADAIGIEGSSVYLCEGEILTVRDLLYALLLESANDAAVALAIECSGSVEAFAEEMNNRANSLGLANTYFKNPHGLSDDGHYTTAYDLALISAAALERDELREIFSSTKATIPCKVSSDTPGGEGVRYLHNHNKMLSLYKGAIGMKTGFTKATGRCLVSAAKRDDLTLIAVTLNAPSDWHDHTAMLDFGFSNYERVTLYDVGEFKYSYPVSGGLEGYVTATNAKPLALTLPRSEYDVKEYVEFPQRFEIAPIDGGVELGCITLSYGDSSVSSPLIAAYSVQSASRRKRR